MNLVYRKAALAVTESQPASLVVVTEAAGHTPQVVGATMLVYPDKTIVGTVGGGRFEHEIIETAAAMADESESTLVTLHLGADLGMCCGGRMQVMVSPLNDEHSWLSAVVDHREKGQTVWVKTHLSDDKLGQRTIGSEAVPLEGARRYETAGIIENESGERLLVEKIAPTPRLILFGAGHVAQPTATLATMMGYRVVVVDNRPEWNTQARFPSASERILESYEDFLFHYEPRATDAVVIVTHGHDFDQYVLEAVVNHDLAYLGMIGSNTKVTKALKRARARGISDDALDGLHAPIGLSIGALTPTEIAVSIAAELVNHTRVGGLSR